MTTDHSNHRISVDEEAFTELVGAVSAIAIEPAIPGVDVTPLPVLRLALIDSALKVLDSRSDCEEPTT